jgi:8-oxo-dGTP pyrophosphatase MutT (NUDIX family)
MANSELYNKTYSVPLDVINSIRAALISNPTGDGVKRAKGLLKNGYMTYQSMKRLKNFFDHTNPQTCDKVQYALAGGQAMRNYIESTLASDRKGVQMAKSIKRDMTSNPNSELKPYQTPRLNEVKKKLNKNVVAVVVNEDNKILLLKRADVKEIWMPSKWGLVGGGIEKGESAEKACSREIKEETELEINEFVKSFTIQRHPDSIETILACRYEGDPTEITLNFEHTNYGWFGVEEMKYLDIVPHLIEYITLVFKPYD